MADHLDAPGLTSPAMDARVDITDLYAFQKPGDASKSILILNVNPLAPSHADEFRSDARYEILIDNDGDARADVTFRITFSKKNQEGEQFARVVRVAADNDDEDDPRDRDVHYDRGDHRARVVFADAPVSFGRHPVISHSDDDDDRDGYRFFAGFRSDPFFFDLLGFLAGFKFTGSDFFADKNVFGIVLEVPNRAGLGRSRHVGMWSRTLIRNPSPARPRTAMLSPPSEQQSQHSAKPSRHGRARSGGLDVLKSKGSWVVTWRGGRVPHAH